MALPQPQFVDALLTTLEDPANQTPELASALRDAADTYSETETDQKIQDAIDALPSTGDVTGPAGAVVGNLAVFDDVSGKVLADSLVPIVDVEGAVEKTDFLTVTAATDLDEMRTRVTELDAAVVLKGTWDASGGSFPGSGTAQAGDSWIVSTGGTVDGVVFTANDRLIAIIDNASTTTFAANWFKADYTDAVLSINGQTGAVTIEAIVHAASSKTTPVDADEIGLVDSAASNVLKKLTWANLKATLKTYFDGIYGALAVANQWTKPQWASAAALTSGTTVTPDLADNNDFTLTLAHNATLANPSSQSTHVNQKGTITITQDGTGGRTLSFGSNWKAIGSASAPSINTTAGVTSCIDYHVLSSTVIRYSLRAVGAA
ncbi:MAG: hypothetical protein LCH99_15505 [Proteobacteria bacterium]|nr:hypothetical protein [Pseudomonadota bacterium]